MKYNRDLLSSFCIEVISTKQHEIQHSQAAAEDDIHDLRDQKVSTEYLIILINIYRCVGRIFLVHFTDEAESDLDGDVIRQAVGKHL